jgi:hypothetical protein
MLSRSFRLVSVRWGGDSASCLVRNPSDKNVLQDTAEPWPTPASEAPPLGQANRKDQKLVMGHPKPDSLYGTPSVAVRKHHPQGSPDWIIRHPVTV